MNIAFTWRNQKISKQQALTILKNTRTFLSKPGTWVRGDYKIHKDNGGVSYCLVGAINRFTAKELGVDEPTWGRDEISNSLGLQALAEQHGFSSAEELNDLPDDNPKRGGSGVKPVLKLLDERIAQLEKSR